MEGPQLEQAPLGDLGEEVQAGLREIEETKRRARGLLGSLRAEQWSWKRSRERWSVGECVAHINQTNRTYIPAIETALRKGKERGALSPGPYRHGFLGELLIREMEPPVRRRFRAHRVFAPPAGETGPAALAEFETVLNRIAELLRRSNGFDRGKVMVASPASRFVRISLGQAFRLIPAHARRHLWQAERIMQEPGFP
jgi:hypothetical protein